MSVEDAEPSIDVPANLASACGIDYVPLATMLATGRASSLCLIALGVNEFKTSDSSSKCVFTRRAAMLLCSLRHLHGAGDFKGADQFTRDTLINAAGEGSRKRGFVYWTDVKKVTLVHLQLTADSHQCRLQLRVQLLTPTS